MVQNEESAPTRRLAAREDRRGGLTRTPFPDAVAQAGVERWQLAGLWLVCAVVGPATLFALWAAPAMRVMDSIRRSRPKADWVLALHGQSLQALMIGLAVVLGLAALFLMRGRLGAARKLLMTGSGGLIAASLAVLVVIWV
ncbi:MAG: hypothetical protein AAF253_09145 [Pseudomonadota bacterium]